MAVSGDKIEGVLPALITPYKADGSVNAAMVRRLVRDNIDNGCHGFFVCGSTGEGLFLTPDERKLVARTVIEEVAGQVPVVVHVGAVSTDIAAMLAKDAKKIGAAAVSSLPPIYYKVGLAGMMQHIRRIAQAAELPTYYYHIPKLTGVELDADEIVEQFTSIEGLAGLKFTHPDMFLLWWLLEASGGRLRVFNGSDQMLYHGLSTGACGGIGSTYNYQMRTIAGIYEAVKAGNLEKARQTQWQANKVIQVLFRHGASLSAEKAIMKLKGFDVGQPRSPMVPFPDDRLEALRNDLQAIGFFDA